jgi:uroporphyrinogen III methyltransferase/synthase
MSRSTSEVDRPAGRVFLVGAGPGDPDLITLRGLKLLRDCEAVVFDRLIPAPLLSEVSPDCEKIDVGKQPGRPRVTQEEINRILVDLGKSGRRVVRLKGGDPSVFGRSGEEIAALVEAGIAVEVVPGVTAASAAAAYLKIPLTHRRLSSFLTLATAHEDPLKQNSLLRWSAFAQGGTLVFYMVGGRIPQIAERLLKEGLSSETSTAIVIEASKPQQRMERATLSALAREEISFEPGFPAVLIVGDVVDPSAARFPGKPLEGLRIALTHPAGEGDVLREGLLAEGAEVFDCPSIAIAPPVEMEPLVEAARSLAEYDGVLLTSKNAVESLAWALSEADRDARALSGCLIAAVGEATAQKLWDCLRLRPDLIPQDSTGEGLARVLAEEGCAAGRKFLFPCSEIAREDLPAGLEKAGARVDRITAYRTVVPVGDWDCLEDLREVGIDLAIFTSSSTVEGFREKLGAEDFDRVFQSATALSIGRKTSATLREHGVARIAESKQSKLESLLEWVRDNRNRLRPS